MNRATLHALTAAAIKIAQFLTSTEMAAVYRALAAFLVAVAVYLTSAAYEVVQKLVAQAATICTATARQTAQEAHSYRAVKELFAAI